MSKGWIFGGVWSRGQDRDTIDFVSAHMARDWCLGGLVLWVWNGSHEMMRI